MSENIGQLYIRNDSEDEPNNGVSGTGAAALSAIKSPSLSSLRNLRDTFKRSDSVSSQTSTYLESPAILRKRGKSF